MEPIIKCDNCCFEGIESDFIPLVEVKDLTQRLDPGSEVPVGECKQCGTFAYFKERPKVTITVLGGTIQDLQILEGPSRHKPNIEICVFDEDMYKEGNEDFKIDVFETKHLDPLDKEMTDHIKKYYPG